MKKFSFLLKDGFRIDVKATKPITAYKKLLSIPKYSNIIINQYIDYKKDSSVYGWKTLEIKK